VESKIAAGRRASFLCTTDEVETLIFDLFLRKLLSKLLAGSPPSDEQFPAGSTVSIFLLLLGC